MRKRRYEMLLPLTFNDGSAVPEERFYQTRIDLMVQFGSLTLEPSHLRGIWTHQGNQYEDELIRIIIDVDDTPENFQFFLNLKATLLERFEQIDLYLASYPVVRRRWTDARRRYTVPFVATCRFIAGFGGIPHRVCPRRSVASSPAICLDADADRARAIACGNGKQHRRNGVLGSSPNR